MTHVKTLPDPTEIASALRSLSPRQREVLSMAAGGLTTTEISERLSLPTARADAISVGPGNVLTCVMTSLCAGLFPCQVVTVTAE